MAYSYGRKYYKKKYGYKSYGRKKYYKKAAFYKQMRSLNTGTSSTLVQITRSGLTNFTFNANSNTSNVLVICPWGYPSATASRASWTNAVSSPLYQTYEKIYDEVKLERMEISMAPSNSLVSGSSTLMIYSAVDRKFTGTDTVQSVAQLTQAAGVVVKNIQPASTIPFKRVVYAKDLQERIMYYDSTSGGDGEGNRQLRAYMNNTSAFVAFSPGVSYGLLATTAPSSQQSISFLITVKYYLRFRNPKTEIAVGDVPVSKSLSNGNAGLNLNPPQNDVVVEESKDADSTVK